MAANPHTHARLGATPPQTGCRGGGSAWEQPINGETTAGAHPGGPRWCGKRAWRTWRKRRARLAGQGIVGARGRETFPGARGVRHHTQAVAHMVASVLVFAAVCVAAAFAQQCPYGCSSSYGTYGSPTCYCAWDEYCSTYYSYAGNSGRWNVGMCSQNGAPPPPLAPAFPTRSHSGAHGGPRRRRARVPLS